MLKDIEKKYIIRFSKIYITKIYQLLIIFFSEAYS